MNKFIFASLLLLAFTSILTACDSPNQHVIEIQESKKYSFTQFIENIESFPFVAKEEKISKIKSGFERISLKMGKNEIETIIGAPDSEMFDYKENKLIGSAWGYYIERTEKELANERLDKILFLYFSENGQLYWAQPVNLEGLVSIGGPY